MVDRREDRRVLTRTTPDRELRVYDLDTGELRGRVGDLTTAGMRLIGDQALEPGKRYHLRLAAPAELLGYATNIIFEAVCGRCSLDADQQCCITGLFDLTAEPGNIDAIEMLILRFNLARI